MREIAKKILSFFPAEFPNKLYNTWLAFPPLKLLANFIIRRFIPYSIKIEEGEIILNKSDVTISGALALGAFEKVEIDIFRKTIHSGMNIVDMGANIGYYTIVAARRVGSKGKVFAFEPEETNVSFLRKNIEHNHLTNTIVEQKALSNSTGKQTLFLTKNNKGTHSLVNNRNTKNKTTVEIDTLDNALKKYDSPIIDIIKMDIEGAEVLALEGMRETISRNPHLIIFSEFYPKAISRFGRSPKSFLETFQNLGFTLFIIDENKNTLEPLNDFEKLIKNFPKHESFKNLYAVKTATNQS